MPDKYLTDTSRLEQHAIIQNHIQDTSYITHIEPLLIPATALRLV